MMATVNQNKLTEVAMRIREMREIMGFTTADMAEKTEVSVDAYEQYESGALDFPFSFIHKCSLAFGIDMTDLLEGRSKNLLSGYTVTRKGQGQQTAKEDGIAIANLAPRFRDKIAEPYWVRYEYNPSQANKPIHLATHSGQEFDLIISGKLKVQIGDHTEILSEGDSIYYDSSTPHGMIAVDGEDCVFCAVVLPGEDTREEDVRRSLATAKTSEPLICEKFVDVTEDEHGALQAIDFRNTDVFNFGFDIVDEIADKYPDKLAMLHLDKHRVERRFTFKDIKH